MNYFYFFFLFFFFNDTATTEIYTLSLHDARRSRVATVPSRRVDPRLSIQHAGPRRQLAVRPRLSRSVSLLCQRARLQDLRNDQHHGAPAARSLRFDPDRPCLAAWPLARKDRRASVRDSGAGLAPHHLLLPFHSRGHLQPRLHIWNHPGVPRLSRDGPRPLVDHGGGFFCAGGPDKGNGLHDGNRLPRLRGLDLSGTRARGAAGGGRALKDVRRDLSLGARTMGSVLHGRAGLSGVMGSGLFRARALPAGLAGHPQGRPLLDGSTLDRADPRTLVLLRSAAALLRDRDGSGRPAAGAPARPARRPARALGRG